MASVDKSGFGAPPSPTWVDPKRFARVFHPDPESDSDWDELVRDQLANTTSDDIGVVDSAARKPLARIIKIVRDRGCRSVIVEYRYVDADYRSEYARFWSRTFQGRSPWTRRLHFFAAKIDDHQLGHLPRQEKAGYLGYTVIRPVPRGAVGRTVIATPVEYDEIPATFALVNDTVQLAGREYAITGAPFAQQDGQLLRCAHVAAWMCHYAAYRRGWVGRQVTAAFTDAAPATLSDSRALPSQGLTTAQLQAIFTGFGIPSVLHDLGELPVVGGVNRAKEIVDDVTRMPRPGGEWNTQINSIVCRYLNSGLPVIVCTDDVEDQHAFTLVGWYRDGGKIRYLANDDREGPYTLIESAIPESAQVGPDKKPPLLWSQVMIPLPPNAFVTADAAEAQVFDSLEKIADLNAGDLVERFGDAAPMIAEVAKGVAKLSRFKLRTSLWSNSEYKVSAERRGLSPAVVSRIRLTHLAHWLWVVEVHEVKRCEDGGPCVALEYVFDSTSESDRPRANLLLLPGSVVSYEPPGILEKPAVPNTVERWRSGLQACGTSGTGGKASARGRPM